MNFDAHLVEVVLTVVFSFLIGLEVKTYRIQRHQKEHDFFGTTRTLTFTGLIGYIFYTLEPRHFTLYLAGLVGYTLLYALFYQRKLAHGKSSILLYLVSLLVYSFGPLLAIYPPWMAALLFVLIIFILNARGMIEKFTESTDTTEFETLGKMVLLSGVILPLLPDHPVSTFIPLSPFKIWMAVVIISGISYLGYLLQKYLFPDKGYFLTGLVGGLYSSTAATVVLAKKRALGEDGDMIDAGIVAATAMMYLRLIVVAGIFNIAIAKAVAIPFGIFALISLMLSFLLMMQAGRSVTQGAVIDKNPLELGTALLFATLFVVMIYLTSYVTHHYGMHGLQVLSLVTGMTDIDPFILSLLTGKYSVTQHEILSAIMIAAGSNNLLKGIYALWFGSGRKSLRPALMVMLLGIATIGWAFWI